MESLKVKDFNLEFCLDCGQFFLFVLIEDSYEIINGKNKFRVRQKENILFYEGISKKDLIEFFNLNEDYEQLILGFKEDEYLNKALENYRGLRLIKQDLWQCIISFVCSSASNIPKIQKNLKLICKFFGKDVFPEPGDINDLDKLKLAKTGYRADYIYEINKIILDNPKILDEIELMSYEDAKKKLMNFPGIGVKVAECICLFGLGHKEAFPIDTWIKQVIEKLYLGKKAKNLKEIEKFIEEYFGENKGFKQQYLFYYARNNLK